MNIDLVILTLCVATTILLGIVILLRNPNALINKIFAFFSLTIATWGAFNYLADHGPANFTLLFTRLTFLGGVFIGYAIFLLSCYFPDEKLVGGRWTNRLIPYLMTGTAILSMTPFIVRSSVKGSRGAMLHIGPLYIVFLAFVALILITVLTNFTLQYRKTRLLIQKTQIRLVLAGILLYGVFTIAFNLIIPLYVKNWTSSRYGPIFALFTVALTGYTIVRHKLLDIRFIVIRSLAYIESLIVVAVLYGFIIFGIADAVLNVHFTRGTQVYLALTTGIAALVFPYIKDNLNRITNKFFYRDAYDVQEFFNDFNQCLVATLDLEKLLQTTTKLIADTLKADYCVVLLTQQGPSGEPVAGMNAKFSAMQRLQVAHHKNAIAKLGLPVIVADLLPANDHEIRHMMNEGNIAMIAHLGGGSKESMLGYAILGGKKSGNSYNSQDVSVIETVSNELVIAIQNALRFEEIEQFNTTLQETIDQRTRSLRQANQKLRKLDETKDDFISMASHQLRTPLTSVKGYVSMVLDGDAGSLTPLQKKLLNQSFISAQRMVYLISDLLNVSRLRTGKFIIEPVPTNLATMVQEEVKQLVETAKGRNLELVYHRPEHFPTLMLDETKIRQVIMNFIDNAIYYTPSGGRITISLVDKPQNIELTVTDNGIGVPRGEQHHLFSKFYRADNAKRARPDGTGLGLFMAKKVIVAQGGATIFKSQEGKGSTFGFTFVKAHLIPPAK
ncbi:MAG: ATP-binding protein [Candidatus Saccharibacteria bacterium]